MRTKYEVRFRCKNGKIKTFRMLGNKGKDAAKQIKEEGQIISVRKAGNS